MITLGGHTWARDNSGDWRWVVYGNTADLADASVCDLLDEIERLRTELERTRQAWVNGDDPMCEDVCVTECKGPCGVTS